MDFINRNNVFALEGDLVEIGTFLRDSAYKLSKYIEKRASNKKLYVVDIFNPGFDVTRNLFGLRIADIYFKYLKTLEQEAIFKGITKSCKNIAFLKDDSKKIIIPS
jgi:hypothetical protein